MRTRKRLRRHAPASTWNAPMTIADHKRAVAGAHRLARQIAWNPDLAADIWQVRTLLVGLLLQGLPQRTAKRRRR